MAKRKANQASKDEPRRKAPRRTKAMRLAINQQNAIDSPLLSLPWDIRERILRFLLGDMLLRFPPLNPYYDRGREQNYIASVLGPSNNAVQNNSCPVIGNDRPHSHEYGFVRYEICKPRNSLPWNKKTLAIMSASYQLYDEANLVFWSTNTFSFFSGHMLSKFISKLNVMQRRDITNLHLMINAEHYSDTINGWDSVLNKDFLQQMHGLKKLQLCIHSGIPFRTPRDFDLPTVDYKKFVEKSWSRFRYHYRLEALRWVHWQEVSVALSDRLSQRPGEPPVKMTFFDDRNIRYAEELRALLLHRQTISSFKAKRFGEQSEIERGDPTTNLTLQADLV